MTNTTIRVNAEDLHVATPTLKARFAASHGVKLVNVPQEANDLYLRVFKPDGQSYFDCPASQDGNGDWQCVVLGTCFPSVGRGHYEIHCVDESGNWTSLGRGEVLIDPFSIGGEPITAGSVISVATLPDKQGRLHRVVAVNIGTEEKPDWTWEVQDVISDDGQLVGVLPDETGALHQVRTAQLGTGELVPQTDTVDGTGDKVL